MSDHECRNALPTHIDSIGRLSREKIIYECKCGIKFTPEYDKRTGVGYWLSEDRRIRVEST